MNPKWQGHPEPAPPPIKLRNIPWIIVRGIPLILVVFSCLLCLLILRWIERPIFRHRRPWTPSITVFVCRATFFCLGLPLEVKGKPMKEIGAAVANHCSWLEIFALNAPNRLYFVAKREVGSWPVIGWFARATGTLFIERKRSEAARQRQIMFDRIRMGHHLLFFPEGTTTDGRRLLPFKSTLFEAFFDPDIRDAMSVQPISVAFHAPDDQDPAFYAWWGDSSFPSQLLKVLGQPKQGRVELIYHPPLTVADFDGRKALAVALENAVRRGLDTSLGVETPRN